MQEEPRAVVTEELNVPFGSAVFESLMYPHSIWRVNRITLSRDGFSYEVYGSFRQKDAGNMAWRLPPACDALDRVKATAGLAEFRPPRAFHVSSRVPPAHAWHLRVDDDATSGLAVGDRFPLEEFGRGEPLEGAEADAVPYPEHPAVSHEPNVGRPAFA